MKKNWQIILIFSLAIFCFVLAGKAEAVNYCGDTNVWGWAWSENIGWISMNSANCDSDCNGTTDTGNGYSQCVPTSPTVAYGVKIASSTGIFSGYAWSNNIGWISFNSSDLTECPLPPCEAKVNTTTAQVSGWARALVGASAPGGWDGWIKLRKDTAPAYGVSINTSTVPFYEFEGWAWGGDDSTSTSVVGWASFNCTSSSWCPFSDYKVLTDWVPPGVNWPPTAKMECDNSGCSGGTCTPEWAGYWPIASDNPCLFTINNTSTDPNGLSDIATSSWYVRKEGESYPVFPTLSCSGLPEYCSYTIQASHMNGTGTYYIKLDVEDSKGATSSAEHDFFMKAEIIPSFWCSEDQLIWQSCHPFFSRRFYRNKTIWLEDTSTASEDAEIIWREWSYNGNPFSSGAGNSRVTTTLSSVDNQISLTVEDDNTRRDTASTSILTYPPPPSWQEVIVNGLIKRFQAAASILQQYLNIFKF